MEFIPKYIKQVMAKRNSEIVTSEEWNAILNLLIQQGDHNSEFLTTLTENISTTEEVIQLVNNAVFASGNADMNKAIYDTNNDGIVDVAETVAADGVKTNCIKDDAVTQAKLSNSLKQKLDYLHSSVSKLLIIIGASAEIEGSADLVLFGLDGSLETPYSADVENLVVPFVGDTKAGMSKLKHWSQNLEETVKTNKYYTLRNEDCDVNFKTTISDVTNATLVVNPTIQQFNCLEIDSMCHIEDNYYAVAIETASYYSFLVVKHNLETNTFEVIHTLNAHSASSSSYIGTSVIKKGNTVYGCSERFTSSDEYHYMYKITKEGIINTGDNAWSTSCPKVGCGKYFYVYQNFDSDGDLSSAESFRVGNNVLITSPSTSTRLYNKQLTEKYVYVYLRDSKYVVVGRYIVNLETESITTLSETQAELFDKTIISDLDGIHFYVGKNKYTLNDDFTVNLIESYPEDITSAVEYGYIVSKTGVSKLTTSGILPVYSLTNYQTNSQSTDHAAFKLIINHETLNGALLYNGSKSSIPDGASGILFTEGSITLSETLPKDIPGQAFITREQSCTVALGISKQIYLKPDTQSNTFSKLNLIINLNRALESSDLITVEVVTVIDGVLNKTNLAELESNITTTKYYEHTFTEPASDIDIIVTVTNGTADSELKITQILGGVDNEI